METLRRRRLFGKLNRLVLTFSNLHIRSGLFRTTFSRAPWNDSRSSEGIAIVRAGQGDSKALKILINSGLYHWAYRPDRFMAFKNL